MSCQRVSSEEIRQCLGFRRVWRSSDEACWFRFASFYHQSRVRSFFITFSLVVFKGPSRDRAVDAEEVDPCQPIQSPKVHERLNIVSYLLAARFDEANLERQCAATWCSSP